MKNNKGSRRIIIHWFRRDLRLEDNRGFAEALRRANALQAEVLPLFIFDNEILKRLEDKDDARVTFIHDRVTEMRAALEKEGSDIYCAHGAPLKIWQQLIDEGHQILAVTWNEDYEPAARARDGEISKLLGSKAIPVHSFKDQVVFEKNEVAKDDGKPYTVFTPFSKKWRSRLKELIDSNQSPLKLEKCAVNYAKLFQGHMPENATLPSFQAIGFKQNRAIVIPSDKVATELIKSYASKRDLPAVKGTSHLGIHLRFGTLSVRRLVAKALELDADVWLGELIWREFFMQILWHFPHVVDGAFRPEYERIHWRNNEAEFAAWCAGRTGYPLVDAGIRELNATGFMHNRVRMVAGSFLVKHLLIDWRWGEAYFARKLLDFELSANNGNWQWVAGSGCDAAPYFRVFNPELQLKRFDAKHEYVKKWVPEFGTDQYPAPMVDHQEARARVLRAYAVVKAKSE